MKQPIKIIKEMVAKYPNDMELGKKIRAYIQWLYMENKPKDDNGIPFKFQHDDKWSVWSHKIGYMEFI